MAVYLSACITPTGQTPHRGIVFVRPHSKTIPANMICWKTPIRYQPGYLLACQQLNLPLLRDRGSCFLVQEYGDIHDDHATLRFLPAYAVRESSHLHPLSRAGLADVHL